MFPTFTPYIQKHPRQLALGGSILFILVTLTWFNYMQMQTSIQNQAITAPSHEDILSTEQELERALNERNPSPPILSPEDVQAQQTALNERNPSPPILSPEDLQAQQTALNEK